MAKGGRARGGCKSKCKEKAPMHQPDVVGDPASQTVTADVVRQTIDPMNPMQHILNPAGGKIAAFMESVQHDTTPAFEKSVLNRQQSFEVIQTMLSELV
ncbi:hypothetical protein MMC18_006114 [Xylographa bjoerkii]|nr:hypothetical protein [Xylographa bjoerkii]